MTRILRIPQWFPLGANQMSLSAVTDSALVHRNVAIANITAEMARMSLTVVSGVDVA